MVDITTKLAGVRYGDAQTNIERFGCPDIGTFELLREPDNPHDPNAISVSIGSYHLGYIPRHICQWLAPKMDGGKRLSAEFVRRNEHPYHSVVGLTVRIVEISTRRA